MNEKRGLMEQNLLTALLSYCKQYWKAKKNLKAAQHNEFEILQQHSGKHKYLGKWDWYALQHPSTSRW